MPPRTIWDDRFAHLAHMPDYVLRDLGRNESASHDYRSFAVELLVNRKSPLVAHPDLAGFLHELDVKLEDIEFAKPDLGPGPMIASITTESLWSEPEPVSPIEPVSAIVETSAPAETIPKAKDETKDVKPTNG